MTGVEIGVAIAIVVGVLGVVVPVLPGSLLVGGAVLVWAVVTGGATAWIVFAVVALFLALGTVIKYLVPGRGLKADGIPNRTLLVGAVAAVAGLFVIPVVGAPVGFVLGIYLAELQRLGTQRAWPSTVGALRAVGLSILIETTACALAAAAWVAGVAVT